MPRLGPRSLRGGHTSASALVAAAGRGATAPWVGYAASNPSKDKDDLDASVTVLSPADARADFDHAIKDEIHVKLDENPAFFTSLRERLEQILADLKAKRIDAAEQLHLFEALTRELRGQAGAAEKLGLTETGFAIYGLLVRPRGLTAAETTVPYGAKPDEAKVALAEVLEEQLGPQVAIVDWAHKDDVQREMRRLIKKQLKVASYPVGTLDTVAESVVDLLKRRPRA